MSGARFTVPQFQREYAWDAEDVEAFWTDLRRGLEDESYFLGLVILTGKSKEKSIVDGQQRLLTLTLLASALYHEAIAADRRALAERLQSTFLRSIDFDTDEELPRITLSGYRDSATLQTILEHPAYDLTNRLASSPVSSKLMAAYRILSERLRADLTRDPFKRLGLWADFLTNRLYLANFVHPDPASAFKVFEVVNTRGKELTTADLLKSYVLSQTKEKDRQQRYDEWQEIATQFPSDTPNAFVQFIRHAVTLRQGHILPKDLYDALAGGTAAKSRLSPNDLMALLKRTLPLYLQMMDPATDGPANLEQLGIFSALSRLAVISVRPILLAMSDTSEADAGMEQLLKLVVRRMVVGNLGTGNVERRFGQVAQRISDDGDWRSALSSLADLNPDREEFRNQLQRRSLNKNVLAFLRQSIIQDSVTPSPVGSLHLIMPKHAVWSAFSEDRASYWSSTIGNSLLVQDEHRPQGTGTWDGVIEGLLPLAIPGEFAERIHNVAQWDENAVRDIGSELAEAAVPVWYD